ncbi:hypothetical protein AB4Z32_21560 [Massilia sp. 2TAF26]|uniref:hypothetical protein n=1 Tax=Massilia sp. 2TAF26 TaxID=3233012 RepID=UPI003F9C4DD0
MDKTEKSRFAVAGDRWQGHYSANARLVYRKNEMRRPSQGMANLDCRQGRASRKDDETTRTPADQANAAAAQPFLLKLLLNHMQNRQVQLPNQLQNHIVCGKTPAYPQRQMCRSQFFAGQSVFVQDRFKLDTMFFQLIRQHVNR